MGDQKYLVFPGRHGLTYEFGDKYNMCSSKARFSGLKWPVLLSFGTFLWNQIARYIKDRLGFDFSV